MVVGIHGKDFHDPSQRFVKRLIDALRQRQIAVRVSDKFHEQIKAANLDDYGFPVFDPSGPLASLDFFLSLGGDGTMLESVTYVGKSGVPILGVNTGRMGFLATTAREEIDAALDRLEKKEFVLDERILLDLISTPHIFDTFPFALNDFTLVKKDTSSMVTVHVYVDGEKLNSYWSDGLIVSTPTGSTGYSLSCGGPLVSPQSNSFIITPVSPHNLGSRPIVIPDTSEISLKIEGRSKKYLVSLDSRIETIDSSFNLAIKKAEFGVKLVQLQGKHYFQTLKEKLNWGADIRN